MLSHIYYAIFQDAAWSAALAAWSVFVVTALAAGFGVPAAIAAAKTFQLESDPIILIREKPVEESIPPGPGLPIAGCFVVAGMPLIGDGVELREESPNDASNPNFRISLNKSVTVILHNAGRSPALAVRVPFTLTVPYDPDVRDRDPESDSFDIREKEGAGAIVLPGIGPNESIYVSVQNLLGNAATLTAKSFGTCTRIEGRKHKERPLAIVALRDVILPGA